MRSLAKFACALMAMAVGAVSLADEVALAHWRMTLATNGYVAVECKVGGASVSGTSQLIRGDNNEKSIGGRKHGQRRI